MLTDELSSQRRSPTQRRLARPGQCAVCAARRTARKKQDVEGPPEKACAYRFDYHRRCTLQAPRVAAAQAYSVGVLKETARAIVCTRRGRPTTRPTRLPVRRPIHCAKRNLPIAGIFIVS